MPISIFLLTCFLAFLTSSPRLARTWLAERLAAAWAMGEFSDVWYFVAFSGSGFTPARLSFKNKREDALFDVCSSRSSKLCLSFFPRSLPWILQIKLFSCSFEILYNYVFYFVRITCMLSIIVNNGNPPSPWCDIIAKSFMSTTCQLFV